MTMFRSEIGSGLGELGGTPPRIPTNTAPPPSRGVQETPR